MLYPILNFANQVRRRAALLPYSRRRLDFCNAVFRAIGMKPISTESYAGFKAELLTDVALSERYAHFVPRLREIHPHKSISDWRGQFEHAARAASIDIFYILPRVLRPALIVETGVASGATSAIILAALARNGHGELHSFDLPPQRGVTGMGWTATSADEVGFLIPEELRPRWCLTLGDATYELPSKLAGKSIDCFFHDSDHSFAHMTLEYSFAAKHLASNGWVVSDDISMNDSFFRFFRGAGAEIVVHADNPNIGLAVPH